MVEFGDTLVRIVCQIKYILVGICLRIYNLTMFRILSRDATEILHPHRKQTKNSRSNVFFNIIHLKIFEIA